MKNAILFRIALSLTILILCCKKHNPSPSPTPSSPLMYTSKMIGVRSWSGTEADKYTNISDDTTYNISLIIGINVMNDSTIATVDSFISNGAWGQDTLHYISFDSARNTITFSNYELTSYTPFYFPFFYDTLYDTVVYDYANNTITEHQLYLIQYTQWDTVGGIISYDIKIHTN